MRLSSRAERAESNRLQLVYCELCGAESGRTDKDGYRIVIHPIAIRKIDMLVCGACKDATSEVQKGVN